MPEEKESIENLLRANQQLAKKESKNRSKEGQGEEIDFENRVWSVVYGLQPEQITIGRDPEIRLDGKTYRPDIFAVFGQWALAVECRYTDGRAFLYEGLEKLKEARRPLQSLVAKAFDNRKVVLLFAVKTKTSVTEDLRKLAHDSDVKIIEDRDANYYRTLMKEAGIGISQQFWARVAPAVLRVGESDAIPAIRIKEGNRFRYIFAVNPHELLERTLISHREFTDPSSGHLGYQRMLKRAKIAKVAKYIRNKGGFPSPIIVSFKKNAGEVFDLSPNPPKRKVVSEDVVFGHLHLPKKPDSIFVVDGQHRLYGYTKVPFDKDQYITVIAYRTLEGRDQVDMFVDINSNQTQVPKKLLWELFPDILDTYDEDYYKAVVSKAVEKVATDRLSGLIEHISSGSKGPITFRTICEEVVRSGLMAKRGRGSVAAIEGINWEDQRLRLETILSAFFDALDDLGKQYHEVNDRFFLTNVGMVPLIRTLGKICKYEYAYHTGSLKGNRGSLAEIIKGYLQPLFRFYGSKSVDELERLRTSRVGGSGFQRTEDEMDDEIRKTILQFPMRAKRMQPDLERESNSLVAEIQAINRKALEQVSNESIFREFDAEKARKRFSKSVKDAGALRQLVTFVHQEVVESTGAQSEHNRICQLLNIQKVNDIPVIGKLSSLRVISAHRETQVEPNKRRDAVEFLRVLAEMPAISGFDDLDEESCLRVQINLLRKIKEEFLDKLLSELDKR